jgi:predicted MFS family arabinose efflux permease
MPSGTDTGPRPQLKQTPRHPIWNDHVRPWLGRRARSADERLTDQLGGPARRTVITLLGMVLGLNAADTSSVGAIAPQLQPALGIGTASIGLLVTVSALVGALAAIPFGLLVDKTRRVDLLAASILLWGAAEVASAFSASFTMLLLTRLLLGAVTATAVPAVASLTGDFFPAAERGRIYGYISVGEVVGAGVGVGVSSFVSAALGWRAAFIVLAVPSVLLAWALWKRLPEPARGGQSHLLPGATRIVSAAEAGRSAPEADEEAVRTDDVVLREVQQRGVEHDEQRVVIADPASMSLLQVVRYVLRVPTNVYIILASSLGFLFLSGLRTFGVLFARGHFDVGQAVATLLLGLVGAGSLLGLLTSGRLADRLVKRGRIDARIVVAGVSFIVAAALLAPALLTTHVLAGLLFFLFAFAALAATNPPLDAAQLDVVPAQLWGRAQGVRSALRNTLEAFGPLLFGLVAGLFIPGGETPREAAAEVVPGQTLGLQIAFLLTLIPLAGAGVLLLLTRRHYPVDVASAGESERRGKAGSQTSSASVR